MAAEIISSILDGPKGVYLVVDATDMKAAFQEFLGSSRKHGAYVKLGSSRNGGAYVKLGS